MCSVGVNCELLIFLELTTFKLKSDELNVPISMGRIKSVQVVEDEVVVFPELLFFSFCKCLSFYLY